MLCHCELPDSFFKTITRASIVVGIIISVLAAVVITQTEFSIPLSCPSRIGHNVRPAIEAKPKSQKYTSPITDIEEEEEALVSSGYAVTDNVHGPLEQALREQQKLNATWWSSVISVLTMYMTMIVCTLAGH